MKNTKWSQKGLKFQYVALNVACWIQNQSWVEISLEKWNAFETDEFSSQTLVLWQRWSSLYTKCIQFFSLIHSTFAHMLSGSNYDTTPSSTFSEFSCSAFQLQRHLAQNKSLKAWKIANEVRKGWNFSMWLWMVHIECTKILEFIKV